MLSDQAFSVCTLLQLNWWTDDLSSALLPQLKMAFAGILTEADITAALAACQGKFHTHIQLYKTGEMLQKLKIKLSKCNAEWNDVDGHSDEVLRCFVPAFIAAGLCF